MSRPRIRHDPLRDVRHLTARDRQLLELLADHQVLTTAQIATALFPSRRAAQKRLAVLHRIGAVARFRWPTTLPMSVVGCATPSARSAT